MHRIPKSHESFAFHPSLTGMPQPRSHVTLVVQTIGEAREEKLMDTAYSVYPCVLVREQVLTNNIGRTYLPAAEIEASTAAWNSIPVVIRHPKKRGMHVSARDPGVLNERGVGFLFNAKTENGELKAEVWLNKARIATVEGAADAVNTVNGGKATEVSTAFTTNVEKKAGEFNGKTYDVVLHDLVPDHLALLPDETGACSVEDGCGLGVNCGCGGKCKDATGGLQSIASTPEKRTVKGTAAALLAKVLAFFNAPLAQNESDEDRRNMLYSALQNAFGGNGITIWIDSVFSEPQQVVFELINQAPGGVSGLYRTTWTEGADAGLTFSEPESVRRVTVFEPVANAAGEFSTKEVIMTRKDMIAKLATNGTLDEATLGKLSDTQLAALCGATPQTTPTAPAVPTPAELPTDVRLAQERIVELNRELATLRTNTATAVENEARERATLTEDLLLVNDRPITDNEIRAFDMPNLRKWHQALCKRPASYAGRSGPQATNTGLSWQPRGIMTGGRGESALDAVATTPAGARS